MLVALRRVQGSWCQKKRHTKFRVSYLGERNLIRYVACNLAHSFRPIFKTGIDRRQFLISSACLLLIGLSAKALTEGAAQYEWRSHNPIGLGLSALAIVIVSVHSGLQVLRLKNARLSAWIVVIPWALAAMAAVADRAIGGLLSIYAMEIANVVTLAYLILLIIATPIPFKGSINLPSQRLAHKKEGFGEIRSRYS